MDSGDDEVPIFTDTNLGTRIAMAISPETTAGELKRELERVHLNCFPTLGAIRVNGVMVKRKSRFYHLPESFPIKHAFKKLKGTWFISINTEIHDHISSITNFNNSLEPIENKGVDGNYYLTYKQNEAQGETSSTSVSVSGIIRKYFLKCDESDSTVEMKPTDTRTRLRVQSRAKRTSRNNVKKSRVGKRILVASNNIRVSEGRQKPAISLLVPKCSSVVRRVVFEISDDD